MPIQQLPAPPAVDRGECVRAASAGFTVLLVGGVATPLAMRFLPYAGVWWLSLVAVLGFGIAGYRIGDAGRPWLHGLAAASVAWCLMLPGRLLLGFGAYPFGRTALELVLAVVVGALAGSLAGRRRTAQAALQAEREAKKRRPVQAERRAQRPAKGKGGTKGKGSTKGKGGTTKGNSGTKGKRRP